MAPAPTIPPPKAVTPALKTASDASDGLSHYLIEAKVEDEAKEIFERFDKNKNKVMEVSELRMALQHVDGIKIDEPTAQKVLKAYDSKPDGVLDVAEFTELMCELKLKTIPLDVPVRHVRSKLGWARKIALDEFVRKNHVGQIMTFEQLQGVIENIGIGDGPETGVTINVGGRQAFSEKAIQKLREMDTDGSGVVTLSEFVAFVESKQASEREKGLLKKGIGILFLIIIGLLISLFGVSMAAGEVIKESKVSGGMARTKLAARRQLLERQLFELPSAFVADRKLSEADSGPEEVELPTDDTPPAMMMSKDGTTVVQTGSPETSIGLFDVPLVLTQYGDAAMSKLDKLTFFIDLPPSWKLATFKIAGYYVDVDDATVANLFTTSGQTININGRLMSGKITMDGAVYAISDTLPEEFRRRLEEAPPLREITMRPVASDLIDLTGGKDEEASYGRRQLRRGKASTVRRGGGGRLRGGTFSFGFSAFQGNH